MLMSSCYSTMQPPRKQHVAAATGRLTRQAGMNPAWPRGALRLAFRGTTCAQAGTAQGVRAREAPAGPHVRCGWSRPITADRPLGTRGRGLTCSARHVAGAERLGGGRFPGPLPGWRFFLFLHRFTLVSSGSRP
jgi:hypothetical protein